MCRIYMSSRRERWYVRAGTWILLVIVAPVVPRKSWLVWTLVAAEAMVGPRAMVAVVMEDRLAAAAAT